MSELADVLDRLLDADELGSLVGRPARAASVRAKPGTLLVLGLADPATGRPTGWARVLWPAASDKAAKTAERARRRGLEVVERSLPGGLVLQSGGIGTDPGLANPPRRRVIELSARRRSGGWRAGAPGRARAGPRPRRPDRRPARTARSSATAA